MKTTLECKRETILEANAALLEQAADLLESIDDAEYQERAALFGGQFIGGHVRHVLEFYEGLANGLSTGQVDYGARKRDRIAEADRSAAIQRLRGMAGRLMEDRSFRADRTLWIASEGSAYALSSLGRELQAVLSHTVHHYALIAVLMRYFGLPVPADFGMSQATIEFRKRQETREAA